MSEPIDLSTRRPHLQGKAVCLSCSHSWIAVAPSGTEILECPECSKMLGIFTQWSDLEGAIKTGIPMITYQLKRIADALEWQQRVVCLADRYFLLADIVHVNPVFNKNLVFWQFGVKTKAGAIHYSQTFGKVTEAEAARAEFMKLWEGSND